MIRAIHHQIHCHWFQIKLSFWTIVGCTQGCIHWKLASIKRKVWIWNSAHQKQCLNTSINCFELIWFAHVMTSFHVYVVHFHTSLHYNTSDCWSWCAELLMENLIIWKVLAAIIEFIAITLHGVWFVCSIYAFKAFQSQFKWLSVAV